MVWFKRKATHRPSAFVLFYVSMNFITCGKWAHFSHSIKNLVRLSVSIVCWALHVWCAVGGYEFNEIAAFICVYIYIWWLCTLLNMCAHQWFGLVLHCRYVYIFICNVFGDSVFQQLCLVGCCGQKHARYIQTSA